MKAIAVTPGVKHSARLVDTPAPQVSDGEVRVKVVRIGIDGTDVEIDQAEYGQAPPGEDFLVIGHESVGRVDSVGAGVKGFKPGDYVVAMVRRPDDCPFCRAGESDMCVKGEYTERGIKGQHGFLSEYYVEDPEYLIKLPPELEDVGVMLEPLTIVEKGVRHAWELQNRMKAWRPQKALILGAGPIGLMAALLTRLRGVETVVYARDADPVISKKVSAIGAAYVSQLDASRKAVLKFEDLPDRFGPFDFILEATGAAQVAIGAMRLLGRNGVLCLTSITGEKDTMEICGACLNLDLVLGNRAVFGSVNANKIDFENGVKDLLEARRRWPGWLKGLITRRVPMDKFRESFERRPGDIKVVVEVGAC